MLSRPLHCTQSWTPTGQSCINVSSTCHHQVFGCLHRHARWVYNTNSHLPSQAMADVINITPVSMHGFADHTQLQLACYGKNFLSSELCAQNWVMQALPRHLEREFVIHMLELVTINLCAKFEVPTSPITAMPNVYKKHSCCKRTVWRTSSVEILSTGAQI